MVIGVAPHERLTSMGRALADDRAIPFLEVLPLKEALSRRFDYPALFVGYHIEGEDKLPRLRKSDERLIQAKGRQVAVSVLAVDYDRPKVEGQKDPWEDSEQPWDVLAKLGDAPDLWPTAFYSTLHGARLVYVLRRQITTREAEELYGRLLDRLKDLGIDSDEQTKDWTRLFSLPFITKQRTDSMGRVVSQTRLWENPTVWCETYDSTLDPDKFLSAVREFQPCLVEGPQPPSKICQALLWTHGNKMTPACKTAKKLLENNPFASYLFDGAAADFEPGYRDTKINTMAWSVARRLFGRPGLEETGPEFIYAVMRTSVAQMEPDADEPHKDWLEVLWEKTCRIWEKLTDEAELQRLTDEEIEQEVLAGWLHQLRKDGTSVAELKMRSGIESEVDLMRRNLILTAGHNQNFLLDQTGNYRTRPTPKLAMHGAIEMMGLSHLYGLEQFGVRVSHETLMMEHATEVHEVVGQLGLEKGRVSGLGTDCVKLYLPTYYLVDLDPLYSATVDRWLLTLAGEHYERLIDWIAHSQDPGKPICALSLTGAPNTGKSFLGELLGARFGPGMKNSEQIFGQWNFRLRDNPVILIDEGLDQLRGSKNIDARFREFVTGGNLVLSQRNVDERSYEVYPRIIIAANNLDALHHIVANRDLDDNSHYALAERILHVEVSDKARNLLRREQTENWIRGDMLALRHFSWLYHNRLQPSKWAGSGRFLVEGDRDSEMLQQARFSSPLIEAVQRVLIRTVESPGNVSQAVELKGGMVVAAASDISDLMTRSSGNEFYHLNTSPKSVGQALRKLAAGRGDKTPKRTWHVPIETLLRYALDIGARCNKLRDLFEIHYGPRQLQVLEAATNGK